MGSFKKSLLNTKAGASSSLKTLLSKKEVKKFVWKIHQKNHKAVTGACHSFLRTKNLFEWLGWNPKNEKNWQALILQFIVWIWFKITKRRNSFAYVSKYDWNVVEVGESLISDGFFPLSPLKYIHQDFDCHSLNSGKKPNLVFFLIEQVYDISCGQISQWVGRMSLQGYKISKGAICTIIMAMLFTME